MTTQQTEALQCAADLEYSIARHGMQDAFTLNAYRAMKMVRTQQARITELESQLAQRFDAADVATASAQGFRDGVAPVSAGSETVAFYAIRLLVAAALITQAKADEALRLAAELTAAHGPADGESNE